MTEAGHQSVEQILGMEYRHSLSDRDSSVGSLQTVLKGVEVWVVHSEQMLGKANPDRCKFYGRCEPKMKMLRAYLIDALVGRIRQNYSSSSNLHLCLPWPLGPAISKTTQTKSMDFLQWNNRQQAVHLHSYVDLGRHGTLE